MKTASFDVQTTASAETVWSLASVGLTQAVSRLALPTPTWRTNCYGHTHRGLQNEPKEKCADQLCHKFFPRAHQKLLHHHYPLSIMSTGPTKMTLVHRRPWLSGIAIGLDSTPMPL
jgi:hypothetical protein